MSEIDPEKLANAVSAEYLQAQGGVGLRTTVTVYIDDFETLREAARAHLATLPKTKEVKVWRVEYAEAAPDGWMAECETCDTLEEAETYAANLRSSAPAYDCIRVTGPHKQRVPA